MDYQELVVYAIIFFAVYGIIRTARLALDKSTEALMKPLMENSIDNNERAGENVKYMSETFQLAMVVGGILIALAR